MGRILIVIKFQPVFGSSLAGCHHPPSTHGSPIFTYVLLKRRFVFLNVICPLSHVFNFDSVSRDFIVFSPSAANSTLDDFRAHRRRVSVATRISPHPPVGVSSLTTAFFPPPPPPLTISPSTVRRSDSNVSRLPTNRWQLITNAMRTAFENQ